MIYKTPQQNDQYRISRNADRIVDLHAANESAPRRLTSTEASNWLYVST